MQNFDAGFFGSFWVIHGVILKSCTEILQEILQKTANKALRNRALGCDFVRPYTDIR